MGLDRETLRTRPLTLTLPVRIPGAAPAVLACVSKLSGHRSLGNPAYTNGRMGCVPLFILNKKKNHCILC